MHRRPGLTSQPESKQNIVSCIAPGTFPHYTALQHKASCLDISIVSISKWALSLIGNFSRVLLNFSSASHHKFSTGFQRNFYLYAFFVKSCW